MERKSPLLQLEQRIDRLIDLVEHLGKDRARLQLELEGAMRENRELRRESRRMAARNAKAKSMLEALANQLPQG